MFSVAFVCLCVCLCVCVCDFSSCGFMGKAGLQTIENNKTSLDWPRVPPSSFAAASGGKSQKKRKTSSRHWWILGPRMISSVSRWKQCSSFEHQSSLICSMIALPEDRGPSSQASTYKEDRPNKWPLVLIESTGISLAKETRVFPSSWMKSRTSARIAARKPSWFKSTFRPLACQFLLQSPPWLLA